MNQRIPSLLLALALVHTTYQAAAQLVPSAMNYQGVIANASGVPLSTGTYALKFRVYSAAQNGTLIWGPQSVSASVVDGQFNVVLGPADDATKTLASAFTSPTSYLEVQVAANNPIAPRQQLLSAPYAFQADKASSLVNSSGTSLVTGSGTTLTVAGTLTATSFAGSGAGLTGLIAGQIPNLDASKITSGFLAAGRIPNLDAGQISTGILGLARIPNLDAAKITSGSLGDARLSANVALRNGPNAFTGTLNVSGTQASERLRLSGPEFYLGASDTEGLSFLLGVNRGGNRQLWIADSARLAKNNSNPTIRIIPGAGMDAVATDGTTPLTLKLGPATYLLPSGNVGIGTASPSEKLTIADVPGYNTGLRVVGSGAETGIAIENTATSGRKYDFIVGTSLGGGVGPGLAIYDETAAKFCLKINPDGNIGIGTTSPRAKLDINGGGGDTVVNIGGYLNRNGANDLSNSEQTRSFSIIASSVIAATEVFAFSDARIKNIQGRSDGATDLATLSRIEITDYTHKDVIAKDGGHHKKVIAQQVEKVYPQAVTQHTDIVPDIYQKAEIKNGWVKLSTNLKRGERVRLLGEKKEGIHEVLEVAEGKFRTDFAADGNQVFVYGREVKDFRSVDYDAIAMLNVSATQELARRLEVVEKRESHLVELEQKAARVENLERELADLKKSVAQLVKASQVLRQTASATPVNLPATGEASRPTPFSNARLDQ